MGWKNLIFLVYVIVCVALSIFLALETVKFLGIELEGLRVVLFMVLSSVYVGLSVGLSYYLCQRALIDEKLRLLLGKAGKFINRGNIAKAEHTLGRLKSLSGEREQQYVEDIKQLESKIASIRKSKIS